MASRKIPGMRAILTGASSGIGRALARQLVEQGARLVSVARRHDKLKELKRELSSSSGQFEFVAGDITHEDTRRDALALAQDNFFGLDLLINNAGIGAMGRFDQATPDRLRQVMEVNFFAAVEMTRLALPALRCGQTSMVVNIGSILGHRGIPFCAEYCASKFALEGFSESLRAECAPSGIDVLVVSPGTTETDFFASAIDAKPSPWRRIQGMSSDEVARKTITAIRRGRREIVLGRGRWLVWANRIWPGGVDRFLNRYGRNA